MIGVRIWSSYGSTKEEKHAGSLDPCLSNGGFVAVCPLNDTAPLPPLLLPFFLLITPFRLNMKTNLTEVALLVRRSSGSGCFATCCLYDATRESPLTGWSAVFPGRPHIESNGCTRCRLHLLQSGAHGGSRWWCGLVCCSWPKGFQSKIYGNPFLLPGCPVPLAQMT